MLKVKTYSIKGTKLADFALPKEYEVLVNLNLLSQARRVYEDNAHFGLRKAKTRAEVIRTTKKLYKQKGTGGARHGSKRAPIFVGGGAAHGPRPVSRVLSLPKKMRQKALRMAITMMVKAGKVVAVDGVKTLKKTKEAANFIAKVGGELKSKRFAFAGADTGSLKFFRNIGNVNAVRFMDLNAYEVMKNGVLVIDKRVFEKAKKEASK